VADSARDSRAGGRAQTERAWLADIHTLTVAPPAGWDGDEIGAATGLAGALAAAARSLLSHGFVDFQGGGPEPDRIRAGAGGRSLTACRCDFCSLDAGPCDLVRDLAGVLPSAGTEAHPNVSIYRGTLARAGGAVFVCRRTLHPVGGCLFATPTADLCGRVLAATHRLG
jgi:hypothetical protein